VDATISEILSHIQDAHDRHTIGDLLRKYDVLRLRLLVKPPGLESDRLEIERLSKRMNGWELYYEGNQRHLQKLYAENKELRAKVASLEDKMAQLLLEWNPPAPRRLFQKSARKGDETAVGTRAAELRLS